MLSIRIEATSRARETVSAFPGRSWKATTDTSTARSEAQDREKDYGRQHGGKREVDAMLKRVTDSLEQTERNPGTGERRTALQSGNEGQQ